MARKPRHRTGRNRLHRLGVYGVTWYAPAMATTKKTATAPRKRGPAPKGYEKMMCRVTPAQAAAVREEAWKRAMDRGRSIVDASEVVREALAAWMKSRA